MQDAYDLRRDLTRWTVWTMGVLYLYKHDVPKSPWGGTCEDIGVKTYGSKMLGTLHIQMSRNPIPTNQRKSAIFPASLQSGALSKMFSLDDVAKSGIVVLPCGAGKTLVGIAACCRVGRRALVLTTTAVAVDQWRRQLQLYTTLPPDAFSHFYHAV